MILLEIRDSAGKVDLSQLQFIWLQSDFLLPGLGTILLEKGLLGLS